MNCFSRIRLFMLPVIGLCILSTRAENWTQFRGPNATGVCRDANPLPSAIGPDRNLIWKTSLAKGHSSPVIHGERIYVTSLRDKNLLTMALDRSNGKIVWESEAPYKKLESVHKIGSHATSSVATDGELVISFFGSCGLFCYDTSGRQLWHLPMGPFNNQFGATSSPLIIDDKIVLVEDHDTGSFLATFDKRTGKQIWRTERPNFRRNYGSPAIWQVDGRKQIVVAGTAHVMGYDLETGEQLWVVRGLCRVVSNSPVVGDDGLLYVASTGGGSAEKQPSFEELIASSDKNKSHTLEPGELPNSPIKGFFGQFDRDADGSLDRVEYESIRSIFEMEQSTAMAIRPGGRGDITDSHVAWTYPKSVPRNSSPLLVNGHLYFVKDGGIMTCLNAKTGQQTLSGRLSGNGKYFSSPVSGDGKIYVLSDRGDLSVVSAKPQWKIIDRAKFGEDVYATPAIADGRIYIRTVKTLYCFGFGVR